jgi:transposase
MKHIHYCIGIDLARRAKNKAVIASNPSSSLSMSNHVFSFAHDADGFMALRDYILKKIKADTFENVALNMEPTGPWRDLCSYFQNLGAEIYFTRTDVVAALRKAYSRFVKTDKIDSSILAGLPWSMPQRMIPYYQREPQIEVLFQYNTNRFQFVKELSSWKNRLHACLEHVWKPLLVSLKKDAALTLSMRKFWKEFPHPADLMKRGRKRFHTWYVKNMHRRVKSKTEEDIWDSGLNAIRLWELINKTDEERITLSKIIRRDIDFISCVKNYKKEVDKEIKQVSKDVPECSILREISGIGPVVSVTIAAILSPVLRFPNTQCSAAYSGFTPRKKASGNKDVQGLRITKAGNRKLKRDLALAADTAMHYDPELAVFAIRLLSAGKHYNKVSCGRRAETHCSCIFPS